MSAPLNIEFDRRRSTFAFIRRTLRRYPGLRAANGFPLVRASWRGHRVDRGDLADFLRLTSLRTGTSLPLIYPHVFGFPLQMVILTHPAFPIGIRGALQTRNHLLQHQPIPVSATIDFETRVAAQRFLEKGAEVDLHTSVRSRDELLWESLNTFYYRGRFGEAGAASALARAPDAASEEIARWRLSARTGLRFARFTGDYNPLHLLHWYARRPGFRRAFHHPQLVLGQCIAHLPAIDPARPQRLDAWLKGPVYYNSDVSLRASTEGNTTVFALIPRGDERPAIVGRWRSDVSESQLLDKHGRPV